MFTTFGLNFEGGNLQRLHAASNHLGGLVMQLSKASLSMLLRRYRSVLKKCHFFNMIGGILLAGSLVFGLPSIVGATDYNNTTTTTLTTDTTVDGTFSNSRQIDYTGRP